MAIESMEFKYYLIKDKRRNLYFGWEDTDICLAPLDHPRWYGNPQMKSSSEYWLDKFKTKEDAEAAINRHQYLDSIREHLEIVRVETSTTTTITTC